MKELERFPVLADTLTLSSFTAALQEVAMAAQQSLEDWLDPQLFSQCNRLIVALLSVNLLKIPSWELQRWLGS